MCPLGVHPRQDPEVRGGVERGVGNARLGHADRDPREAVCTHVEEVVAHARHHSVGARPFLRRREAWH